MRRSRSGARQLPNEFLIIQPETVDRIQLELWIFAPYADMFAHDPLLWDPTERQTPAIINDLISLSTSRGFDVVRLQQYLPVQRGENN